MHFHTSTNQKKQLDEKWVKSSHLLFIFFSLSNWHYSSIVQCDKRQLRICQLKRRSTWAQIGRCTCRPKYDQHHPMYVFQDFNFYLIWRNIFANVFDEYSKIIFFCYWSTYYSWSYLVLVADAIVCHFTRIFVARIYLSQNYENLSVDFKALKFAGLKKLRLWGMLMFRKSMKWCKHNLNIDVSEVQWAKFGGGEVFFFKCTPHCPFYLRASAIFDVSGSDFNGSLPCI